eukprot:NODE_227_length_12294_cov_1.542681.p6 type:complete len:276 gc:universal NODE_227_length_12294_cov_1.542681:3213-2386(-)
MSSLGSISPNNDADHKQALPLKFENHRLIPRPVPDQIRPSNDVLQGRLCDMARHISEWSTDIIDSVKLNKDWMPVNVTADLLKSRLNMVLKAMDDYHDSLIIPDLSELEEESNKEAGSEIDEFTNEAEKKSLEAQNIQPNDQLPFLDTNFASAVAYQQYYPYYYQQPQPNQQYMQTIPQPSTDVIPQQLSPQQQAATQPISPQQMQQLYVQQQYAMQQNPMFMMPAFSPDQQYPSPYGSQNPSPNQPLVASDNPQAIDDDTDFTKLLFEEMEDGQ